MHGGPSSTFDFDRVKVQVVVALAERDAASAAVVLAGRLEERQLIEAAARAARDGRGAALLITGEPGIGKSALLDHAAAVCRQAGLRVYAERARPWGAEPGALARLVAAITGWDATSGRAATPRRFPAGLDDTDRLALQAFADDAAERSPIAPEHLEAACARALRRLLAAQAVDHPLALLVDDVRHLSARERALLNAVVAAAGRAALLVVLADRGVALAPLDPAPLRLVSLAPLADLDAERLIRRLAGERPVHAETLQRVLEAAAGNPLYLRETARLLNEQGRLRLQGPRRSGGAVELARGIRGLVLARFDALDPEARRALIYAAVIGRSFTLPLLSRLWGDADELTHVLERLCADGLLEREPGDGASRLRFCHEPVREAVGELLVRATLWTIHSQIADLLLAGVGGAARPDEIGAHLEGAGRDAEAADWLERAGVRHLEGGAPAEAAPLLERAVAALARAAAGAVERGPQAQALLARARLRLSEALNRISRWDEAAPVAEAAAAAARDAGDRRLELRAGRELARADAERGRLPRAAAALDEAYGAALACGDLGLAADLASDLGEVRERAGDLRQAGAALDAALSALEAAARQPSAGEGGYEARLAEILNRLGRVAVRRGDAARAVRTLQTALRHADAAGDRSLAVRVLGNLGQAQAVQGQPALARETLGRALALARQTGDQLATVKLLYNLARLQADTPERARALARESFDLSVEIGWREGEALGAALRETLR